MNLQHTLYNLSVRLDAWRRRHPVRPFDLLHRHRAYRRD